MADQWPLPSSGSFTENLAPTVAQTVRPLSAMEISAGAWQAVVVGGGNGGDSGVTREPQPATRIADIPRTTKGARMYSGRCEQPLWLHQNSVCISCYLSVPAVRPACPCRWNTTY